MSDNKNIDIPPETEQSNLNKSDIAPASSEVSSVLGSVKTTRTSQQISSDRQIKFERAQKCLENAALVSKRIKEQRKATAELLGRPFEDDDVADTTSEMASTMSERTGYSVATDVSTTLSVQEALNIPGISESLANTLKQKEILLERIKQYKEIGKKPIKSVKVIKKEATTDSKVDIKKNTTSNDVTQLMSAVKDKENLVSVLQVKMKAMETTILDLQEKINEKDQIIEAKNMATTLMSDSLSKKEKDSIALLEDTRQQMIKMQENFVAMEAEWKEEKQALLKELETKDTKISSLEEANSILETSRFEISLEHSKLAEQLELKNKEIMKLEEAIQNLTQVTIETPKEEKDVEEEKGSLEIENMAELTKKIELLEQINCQIRQTNKELENKLATVNVESKSPSSPSPNVKGSPLPSRKGGRNTASKMKSPWSKVSSETLPQETDKKANKNEITRLESLVQSLNKDILEKEYVISQKESVIAELQSQKQIIPVETIDVGVCTVKMETIETVDSKLDDVKDVQEEKIGQSEPIDDSKDLDVKVIEENLKSAQEQIAFLNNEVEAANKNMVKVKSNHKLKIKQMQKTIDNFSKISDPNAEIVKLNEELHQLSQKVAELEEEKGNLQLHLVDYDSGRLTESDIYKKMIEMENLADTRLRAISVLETQKFDLVQELHDLQQKYNEMEDKLADISQLQNEQVCSEIKSVQLEEQIDELLASKKELDLVIQNLKLDKDQLNGTIKTLEEEKEDLMHKLENYIQDNMDLTDKLEKLSAEKVSSAESIEIVESLTTQEKLELEEYSKGLGESKAIDDDKNCLPTHSDEKSVEQLTEQSADLNKKIELFTQEREEVMDKMSKIHVENEILHQKIADLNIQCDSLQNKVELLQNDKLQLQNLNQELTSQLEDIKRERVEILKETVDIVKSSNIEDSSESVQHESQHDEKSAEKGINRTKSVKQLTKEILKLKNTIKEREAEIADSQMKILSLEEQQQKHEDIFQSNVLLENKVKVLVEENSNLKNEIETVKSDNSAEQQLLQYKQTHALLMQQEIQKVHQEYTLTVSARDARINELENILVEYEKQLYNYGNTLQQKDKDIAEYINQVTKLNDISQKLKATVEVLEEEKSKDPNAELVKSLNKQIGALQKKILDCEEKMRLLEEEKSQLLTLQTALENKNAAIEIELKNLQEAYTEKQVLLKELQVKHQKHSDEKAALVQQTKDRDEEIHEIKLQLRKESIENEKLRTTLITKEECLTDLSKELSEVKQKLDEISNEKDHLSQENVTLDAKNKETLEKLKKFAVNLKKKTAMYTELEYTLDETQKQLENKQQQLEQFNIQIETLPVLQDKLKHAEEEINRLQSQKIAIDQVKSQEINQIQSEFSFLESQLKKADKDMIMLNETITLRQNELRFSHEQNENLKNQIDCLNKKIAEYEIEQKTNTNFETKIASLETELAQKQNEIDELLNKFDYQQQLQSQTQFGYDAKMQERDLYIENLETEISKYKNRICRLEESISVMEDRRYSLERKADQLGNQLQEKQKAYSDYTTQEDELVGRLAVLIDHDRVVEKQLHEIENENKELQHKIQNVFDENQRLRKSLSDIQDHCNTLVDKASRCDIAESELSKYQSQCHDVEAHLKRITSDNQILLMQKKKEIEDLESEFNTQIETAFKEKKMLSEKYEKTIERVSQLERRLQDYSTNIETLNRNLAEVNNLNQELIEKSSSNKDEVTPDYTEQYISEINKLNSIINAKNGEISDVMNKMQTIQMNNVAYIAELENKVSELSSKINEYSVEISQVLQKENDLKENNAHLQLLLSQKEEQIRDLVDTKKMSFEMNIPKTEGMVISSTIEPLSDDPKPFDISYLESQIISDSLEPEIIKKDDKLSELVHVKSADNVDSKATTESIIVPKKAYVCYNEEESNVTQEADPFNSDEGWGFGDSEDVDVTPGITNLNEQIQRLKEENNNLKSELDISHNKLVKSLKKLKELKSVNEMLSSEIKLAKQLSQSSFLDNAIEDELRLNIQSLEKKLEELNSDLCKEKKEKEILKKQNEVFNSANDRLTEMKEKLDNEISLWKYKFKEANDKVSTMQWGADTKESSQQDTSSGINYNEDKFREEITKIEKENDELQSIIDQLTLQNKELMSQQLQLKDEIQKLNSQLQQQTSSGQDCESLRSQCEELQQKYNNLLNNSEISNKKICDLEFSLEEKIKINDSLKNDYETALNDMKDEKESLVHKCCSLEEEIEKLRNTNTEVVDKMTELNDELGTCKLKLEEYEKQAIIKEQQDAIASNEHYNDLVNNCEQLKNNLDQANLKIQELESQISDLETSPKNYEEQINELNTKVQELNKENDSLLSTVAELRSSISSAVDQRGFEIAELWKQHLAQREADFQKLEQELRSEVTAAESKYEQLLDNVQSSSQEETNKLIFMEQVSSLQSKLQDKEEHIHNLQAKYAEVMNQLDILRSEMEDEKVTHENKMLEQQEEYEKIIQELRVRNQEDSKGLESQLDVLQSEQITAKANIDELLQQKEEIQSSFNEMNSQIIDLTNEIRLKDSEIYQKTHDYNVILSQRNEELENVRKHLIDCEKKIEDLTYEKESELAIMRLKMHENGSHYEKLKNDFDIEKANLTLVIEAKIAECIDLNKQIVDLNKTLEEHANRTTEMQTALENQEMEIVSLKDEIINLQDMLKVSNSKINKHVSFSSDTKQGDDDDNSANTLSKELLDAVPRAELDLALYMLHQRDVRCEELTMELTQLLEERDTLQLRLSDSLRSQEELKSRYKAAGLDDSISSSRETVTELPSFNLEREQQIVDIHRGQSSRNSSISDPDGDKPKLQAKLSELRSVKHSRDVRLRHESEQRQMDLRLLQRDVANLPPEAVDQLAQAHHTLSRDSQSTPTVLLNWLRGKSTPKVVHM